MPKRNGRARTGGVGGRRRAARGGTNGFREMSDASSRIVRDAAALLDEELAAGIVAAKKVKQRFDAQRGVDSADFAGALQRFQNDGHELLNLLNDQFGQLRSQQSGELVTRLVNNTHDLVDLIVGLVESGADVANQLAQKNLPKRDT
jgi:hypothetical protein